MKPAGFILSVLLACLLGYGALDFPGWGDPAAPASVHLSPYYIKHSLSDTHVPNIVTAVLADYRGYDTMFETIVIFSAAVACLYILRIFRPIVPQSRLYRHIPTGITLRIEKGGKVPDESEHFEQIDSKWIPYDLIIRTTCRMVIPFIQVFALYVIAHGHYSPGGGFQGGVILGASFVLFALGFNLRSTLKQLNERTLAFLAALGIIFYVGTGILCQVLGGDYLDYAALSAVFGSNQAAARSHGILMVETGAGLAVMAVMVILYLNLSSAGKLDEGL